MLAECSRPLVREYDLIALDLDGVIYIGDKAVPHAAEALVQAREARVRLAFVTNNAARTPDKVAAHLSALGIKAAAADVVTSAQAAATLLSSRLLPGGRVFVIGGEGLEVALAEAGLVPVFETSVAVDAVVQGYGPEMPWKRVVSGAILVKSGCLWVASNMDRTIPTSAGIGPGNGALVELVAKYSGREPIVAGKPEAPLLHEIERRHGARSPLFVGDRLDTDVAGAQNVGWPSLLVRTGVTVLRDLVAAPAEQRPQFIAHDLRGLHVPHPKPVAEGGAWVLGGWRGSVDSDGTLVVEGTGSDDDWWRCAVSAAWAALDGREGYPQVDTVRVDDLRPPR